MKEKIKSYLFPKIEDKVQKIVDEESVNNIHHFSLVIVFFELFTLALFVLFTKQFNRDAWISIGSVLFCAVTCLSGWIIAGQIKKNKDTPHSRVPLFKAIYFLILSIWAIWVSRRHYLRGEQLLTFFSVELMMVCFVPVRPLVGTGLMGGVLSILYITLYLTDGAVGINVLNYIVFGLVAIVGMMFRYHSLINRADKTIQLEEKNDLLEYANRHDGLTGLRNRKALEEDVPKLIGKQVSAFMIDINYFKEINDAYGHVIGDEVLAETACKLKALFPLSHRYRYGGDEFLVLGTEQEAYAEDTYQFSVPSASNRTILLSIGRTEGHPESHDQLFELIAKADAALYIVKKRTHSVEFGGHDRRRARQ